VLTTKSTNKQMSRYYLRRRRGECLRKGASLQNHSAGCLSTGLLVKWSKSLPSADTDLALPPRVATLLYTNKDQHHWPASHSTYTRFLLQTHHRANKPKTLSFELMRIQADVIPRRNNYERRPQACWCSGPQSSRATERSSLGERCSSSPWTLKKTQNHHYTSHYFLINNNKEDKTNKEDRIKKERCPKLGLMRSRSILGRGPVSSCGGCCCAAISFLVSSSSKGGTTSNSFSTAKYTYCA